MDLGSQLPTGTFLPILPRPSPSQLLKSALECARRGGTRHLASRGEFGILVGDGHPALPDECLWARKCPRSNALDAASASCEGCHQTERLCQRDGKECVISEGEWGSGFLMGGRGKSPPVWGGGRGGLLRTPGCLRTCRLLFAATAQSSPLDAGHAPHYVKPMRHDQGCCPVVRSGCHLRVWNSRPKHLPCPSIPPPLRLVAFISNTCFLATRTPCCASLSCICMEAPFT